MKMERAYPPSTDSQLTSPIMIGEQSLFILCDGSGAKLKDEERRDLETLAREALISYLKGAKGAINDKTLQDAFEEANLRLVAATSDNHIPISALCVVKEEGVASCLVASAGKCKLLRVDGDQVELAISPPQKGKDKPAANYLGLKTDLSIYLAKVELGVDEVLIALTEEAFKAQNLDSWKNRLASPDTLADEVARALGNRAEGAISWILYPHEDSAPSLPPKRKGLTFSVSLILLACLAILGTSVWMKERRTLLGRATPPSAHIAQALVRQDVHPLAAAQVLDEEWSFDKQELEIAQLRDAMQEVAEVGGDESTLLKQIIAAQEQKIAQMADKEAALAHKLESQDDYVSLLQASLALLQDEAGGPSNTLSLQLSEAIESKEMLERELEAIAAHTALLDQHRQEISRLRTDATEYQETQEAYEELLTLCAAQSEELAAMEMKFADEELTLHTAREELSGRQAELDRLAEVLATTEATKEALQAELEQEKLTIAETQDRFRALASQTELQDEQLSAYKEMVEELKGTVAKTIGLEEEHHELAAQLESVKQDKHALDEDSLTLKELLTKLEENLATRDETVLELQGKLDLTSEALATSEKFLALEQQARAELDEDLAALQLGEQEFTLKLEETEGARALLTQQIDELTESHRLLHGEKRNLEAQIQLMQAEVLDKESRLACAELEVKKLSETNLIAEEARKALQSENRELDQKIASLEKVEQDYAKEHLLRRESDEMLGRLATNIQGWKEAVSSMEDSRKALAEELAELKSYQSSVLKGRVQKAADRTDKKPSVTRIHLVSPGETLEGISRRYYGTTKKVGEIRDANEDLLAEGQQVRVGTALVIP